MKKPVSARAISHLKKDIKGYSKERAFLKDEMKEDKELIKAIKGSKMKKQGYNDRLDEKLGAKNGKKKQSLKSRRDESKSMEKASGKRAYSSVKSMDKAKRKK